MDDQEARRILSEVGKLQAAYVTQGHSQSEARNMAIQKVGPEKHRDASKSGTRAKLAKAETLVRQPELTPDEAIRNAESIMARPVWREFYRTICDALSWVPHDRELLAIVKALNVDVGKSGAGNFVQARSELRKEGYTFNEDATGRGWNVLSPRETERQQIALEIAKLQERLSALSKK